jgi:hypothetical protein
MTDCQSLSISWGQVVVRVGRGSPEVVQVLLPLWILGLNVVFGKEDMTTFKTVHTCLYVE